MAVNLLTTAHLLLLLLLLLYIYLFIYIYVPSGFVKVFLGRLTIVFYSVVLPTIKTKRTTDWKMYASGVKFRPTLYRGICFLPVGNIQLRLNGPPLKNENVKTKSGLRFRLRRLSYQEDNYDYFL